MSGSSQDFSLDEIFKTHKFSKKLHVGWYCWLLTERPILIMFLCFVVVIAFGTVSIVYTNYPDFSEPSKGFEIRGSPLADKLATWHKMINKTGYKLPFSNYPYQYFQKKSSGEKRIISNSSKSKRSKQSVLEKQVPNSSTIVFCDNPSVKYASWSYKLDSNEIPSLWSVKGLLAMCDAEKTISSDPSYKYVCICKEQNSCCPSMTLPNYAAYLAGLRSCDDLTKPLFIKINSILSYCAKFYCDGRLGPHCEKHGSDICSKVPKKCKDQYNAIYAMFHYFFEESAACTFSMNKSINYVTAFIPVYKSQKNLKLLYYSRFNKLMGPISVYSIDFGINDEVFSDYLSADSIYPTIAMLGVSLILLLYTRSLFITLMSFLSAIGAMITSYFLYKVLFDFKFFPFMNLAAILVMVGLAADSVLVFFSAWKDSVNSVSSSKIDLPSPRLSVIMKLTMNRVSWSLFVTCSTTAAAFFASYTSQVTSIKCFSVYTGLTVLANLLLALTWLPASAVIHHKYIKKVFVKWNWSSSRCSINFVCKVYSKVSHCFLEYLRIFFDQVQVLIIVRLRYFWSFFFFSLAVGAFCVVFIHPKFRLPTGQTHFHYFKSSHPFERTNNLKFGFQNTSESYLPLIFIFGVEPTDTGDHRDPSNTGSLLLQRYFDVSHPESQRWLLKFCEKMRNFSYYSAPVERRFVERGRADCFMEGLKMWMELRNCADDPVCCSKQHFPYSRHVFERCLKEAIFRVHLLPSIKLHPRTPGPRFSPRDAVRAVILELPSNLTFRASYQEIDSFYTHAKSYFDPLLETAPPGLANGWFVGELDFFALQRGLYSGTVSSMFWSLLVALLVILITSRNLVISFFASATIGSIICVTVSSLVLLGWELDILESITVSIAVGLSVDYTAHYAIAYLQAKPRDDRYRRVELAVSRTGPAIALAALTTLVAGLGLLPASVLIYYKFGVFLMLTTASSWLLSTYFFIPLLSIAGPQEGCCDFPFRCKFSDRQEQSNSVTMTETSTYTPSSHFEMTERLTSK